MPIRHTGLDAVTATLNGEEDIDPIIQQQVADERAGTTRRALPDEFVRHVIAAREYSILHQELDEYQSCAHRRAVDDWLEDLRWGNRLRDWCDHHERHLDMTPEEEARERARWDEEEAANKLAMGRAKVLLRSILSPKQLKEYDRRGYFHVQVESRRFRITRGRSHNVKEVDQRGRILRTFCAHPIEFVPDEDTMLAQKLMLESDPEAFFRIANVVRRSTRRRERIQQAVLDAVAVHVATGVEVPPAANGNVRAA